MENYVEKIIDAVNNINVLLVLTNREELKYYMIKENCIKIRRQRKGEYHQWGIDDSELEFIVQEDFNGMTSLGTIWYDIRMSEIDFLAKERGNIEFIANEEALRHDRYPNEYTNLSINARISNTSLDQITKLIQIYAKI